MHEMSICEGIVQILQDQAKQQQYQKVNIVYLELGKFSTVEIPALEFCFEVVCRNTLAQGARLEIEVLPGLAWCMNCSKSIEIEQRFDPCPDCDGFQLQSEGGDELRIKALDVD